MDAPPPVEMKVMPLSRPNFLTAAAESPPPTTLVHAALSAMAWPTARVPAAKASISNTPMGPFQKTVLAPASSRAYSSQERGPMSRPIQPSGMAVLSTICVAASAANLSATT